MKPAVVLIDNRIDFIAAEPERILMVRRRGELLGRNIIPELGSR